ncbi:hypothetical protein DPMN_009714 [Dreissena polymorpha]|uniref:Uncharacterized protein n=1 Tax=Dreissena polymorpha TaxID=45954 RepID=A0A9D4S0D2_DREPO|nr:hypothetical protein DPMN_009714 [Dreissena polymorpha]
MGNTTSGQSKKNSMECDSGRPTMSHPTIREKPDFTGNNQHIRDCAKHFLAR